MKPWFTINRSQHDPSKSSFAGRSVLKGGMLATMILTFGLAVPGEAMAKGNHHHKHHKKHHHNYHHSHHDHYRHRDVIVVKERPRHYHYHRSRLPEIATFAIIAGATYAIIDNHYYKKRGDNYEYVNRPR